MVVLTKVSRKTPGGSPLANSPRSKKTWLQPLLYGRDLGIMRGIIRKEPVNFA